MFDVVFVKVGAFFLVPLKGGGGAFFAVCVFDWDLDLIPYV